MNINWWNCWPYNSNKEIEQLKKFISLSADLDRWTKIIIHHSYLPLDSIVVDWWKILRYHVCKRGWDTIGYNFGVEKINEIYKIMVGRPLNKDGGHCRQQNQNPIAIGIMNTGNFDVETPSKKLYQFNANLCRILINICPNIKDADSIYGHRDFTSHKTCPGKKFCITKIKELV